MSAEPTEEAAQQLLLRYQATATIAKLYSSHGFTVICQDVIIGPILEDVVSLYAGSAVQVFVLCPDAVTIQERESSREKTGYGNVSISELQNGLSNSPRVGCWIDNSNMSADLC